MEFFLRPHYPIRVLSTFQELFPQEIFQGKPKTGPRCQQVVFTTVALHRLKRVPRFEKSVHRNFEFGPDAALGCHPESQGLILGPQLLNATSRFWPKWPKVSQKMMCWKTSKNNSAPNGLFLVAPLSQ